MSATFKYSSAIYGKPATLTLSKDGKDIVVTGYDAYRLQGRFLSTPKERRDSIIDAAYEELKDRERVEE